MVHCIVKSAIGALVCSLCLDTISWFSGIITVPYSSSSTDLDSQYLPTVYSVSAVTYRWEDEKTRRNAVWSVTLFGQWRANRNKLCSTIGFIALLSICLQLPVDPQTYIWQEAVHQCKYKRSAPADLYWRCRSGMV